MPASRLLVIEPHCTGHHPTYARWLIEYFMAQKMRVVFATQASCATHTQLAPLLAAGAELLTIELAEHAPAKTTPLSLLMRELAYFGVLKRAYRAARRSGPVDAVVLPYLDYCVHAIALRGSPFGRTPWCGVTMRWKPGAVASVIDRARAWAMRRLLAMPSMRGIFSISPAVVGFRETLDARRKARLYYLPDPAEIRHSQTRAAARSALKIQDDALVVLVFGTIDERKGLGPLLQAMLTDEVPRNLRVLVAGRQSESMRALLASDPYATLVQAGRVIVQDGFLDDLAQANAFGASDVIWVGYVDHRYMSGVLVLAGVARLPVIACDVGEIGMIAREAGLGPVVAVADRRAVANALTQLNDASARRAYGAAAYERFKAHEPRAFGAAVLAALGGETLEAGSH